MMSTVIGGAMLPHALQFFTMPETEDKAVVAHVREVAADIGSRLPQEQREALVKLDLRSMVKMGAHPLAPFLAQLQIERLRPKSATQSGQEHS
jgi:hypothetical protein